MGHSNALYIVARYKKRTACHALTIFEVLQSSLKGDKRGTLGSNCTLVNMVNELDDLMQSELPEPQNVD